MKTTYLMTSILLGASILTVPLVFSDEDWREYKQQSLGVASVSTPLYKEECGSCHMAFSPGLLPARSWQKMMTQLDDHFGDNAELDIDIQTKITDFLVNNSADKSDYRRSRKLVNSLAKNATPLRITEIPYFKHEHNEIPAKMVKDNKQVNSLSHCNACHTKAEQGLFDEHDILIPGFGRWDD